MSEVKSDLNIDINIQDGNDIEVNIETAPPGPKGDPGTSVTHSWDGTVLTINSASGTSSVDLRGQKGDIGISIKSVEQKTFNTDSNAPNIFEILFSDGTKQDITLYNGGQGDSGFSPTINIVDDSNTLTIATEDIDGLKEVSFASPTAAMSSANNAVLIANSAKRNADQAINDAEQAINIAGEAFESAQQTAADLSDVAAVSNSALMTSNEAKDAANVADKKADTLVSKVEETQQLTTEINSKIDNLQIGGRNYILGTGTPSTATNDGAASKTMHLFICKDAETANKLYGKTVVLSFDYESTVSSGYASLNYNNTWQNIYRFRPDDTSGHLEIVTDLNTATAADDKFIYVQGTWVGDVTISNLKLEIGNKSTDWTPALEDAPQGEGGAVTSVNGKTGAVELSAKDVGAQPAGDYPLRSELPNVPTKLSELEQDSNNRLTTDEEKAAWNKKSNFSGAYADLTGKPDIPTVPKNVSAFTNDAGYLTKVPDEYVTDEELNAKGYLTQHQDLSAYAKKSEIPNVSAFITRTVNDLENYYLKSQTYTKDEVNQKVSAIPKFAIEVVSSLPSSEISETTVYLLAAGSGSDLYTEYINVNGTWEILGSQRVDLTGYATRTWAMEQLARYQPKGSYQPAGDYALKSELPTVPTKVSAFSNDAGYLTKHQDISGKMDASRLPEAIDAALAQAKESGEFDGEDGYTPVKGTDYFTAVDIAELIEQIKTDCTWLDGYDIPKLYLTGDMTGISKDNAVTLTYTCTDASGVEHTGTCTLKWQGSSSVATGQRLGGKMNFTIKLDTEIDVGYGEQKKYCLKANAIDHSHARNIVSARIWGMMAATRKSIIGNLASCPNYGAVNGFPCAIVLNDQFHGLYTWNIPKDGWMMSMGSGSQECILCADHSAATQFKGDATLFGETDFEIEYITDENNTAWAVTSVNRLINACINSNGSDLDTTIAQYLDWESAIDYYILVALLDGQDMTDKNYILATYDGTKWFFSAYDMDSCYGLKWDASGFSKASNGTHTSFVNYANNHRLMELIKRFKTDALKVRYAELRADVLSEATIAREFERFAGTIPSRLLDEDRNKWPLMPLTSVNNTFQILAWLNRRLVYMDKWMEELPAQEVPTGPSYTNQVPISTDDSGNVFNGTGYMDGYRLNSSGAETAQEGSTAIGYIPYKSGDIIRIKGVEWETEANAGIRCYVAMYDSNKAKLVSVTRDAATGWLTPVYDDASAVLTLDISRNSNASSTAYVRFNFKGSGSDAIVTVNEEIT